LKFITLVSYNSSELLRNLPNPFSKRSSTVIASHPSAHSSSYPSFNSNYFSPSSPSSFSSPSTPFSSPSPSSPSSPFSPSSPSIGVVSTIRGDMC